MNIELHTFETVRSAESSMDRFKSLTNFLKLYMTDICVKEHHGNQITYLIRDDAEHTRIFPVMLANLDQKIDHYGIKTYGISNSSLEQVFLRVASEIVRPEDYERLSCGRKFLNRLRCLCCRKADQSVVNNDNNDNDVKDEEPFQTQVSGRHMHR
jgi:hypothetical protein